MIDTKSRIKQRYEGGLELNSVPLIHVFDGFITDAEAESIIKLGEGKTRRSTVSGEAEPVVSATNTGSNYSPLPNTTGTLSVVRKRLCHLVGLPEENAELSNILYYDVGQEFKPHYDAWLTEDAAGKRNIALRGQRLLTCLLYLNDVEEGGYTSFPKLSIEVEPVKGRLLIFNNCVEDSVERFPESLHASLPVLAGEKWACTLWFREFPMTEQRQGK